MVRWRRYRLVLPRPRCLISNNSTFSSSLRYVRTLRSAAPMSLARVSWPGEAGVVIPSVFEQHRVGEFGTYRDLLVGENEIRNLSEAVASGKIGADDLDIAVFENVADGSAARVLH